MAEIEMPIKGQRDANEWASAIRQVEEKLKLIERQRRRLKKAIFLMKRQLREGVPWPSSEEDGLMESERKIAARERGESPPSADAVDPSVSATGATDPGTPPTRVRSI